MALIEIRHFSYTYPGENDPVIKDLNWSVGKNSFVAITGKTGCGKSTLGKALAGFLFQDEEPHYSGEIIVNGTDMSQIPLYEASERVAYVQQNPEDQFCTLSVKDEIAFGLENRCVPPNEIEPRIHQALAAVSGLALKNRSLSTLSGGEKQKVAIASMLALSPDVLILDEPTSNLDPLATQDIFDTLNILRKKHDLTVIVIEHKLTQLKILRPELFIFEEGKLHPKNKIQSHRKTQANFVQSQDQPQPEAPISAEAIIRLRQANVKRGEQQVLHDVNLEAFPGEFVAIMGANGSGKSTLLLALMGLLQIQDGTCEIFDKNLNNTKTSELVRDVGFIFQNPDHQLFTQSVWNEITFILKNQKSLTKQKEAEAKDLLSQFGLLPKLSDHPQRLSYGEKRRLNLVSVLLHYPKLLLIDELLIGQDKASSHSWMSFLQKYARKGNTVILVNHHAEMTATYCNRIIFLEEGYKIIDAPVMDAFKSISDFGYNAFLPSALKESVYA